MENTELTQNEENRPSITHDAYMELLKLRARQNEVKAAAFDLKQFIENGKSQLAQAEGHLKDKLGELEKVNEELNSRYNELVVAPYNIKGDVKIEESEPHYIVNLN